MQVIVQKMQRQIILQLCYVFSSKRSTADCVHSVLALRDQNIDLPPRRDDLFRLVSLPCHYSPLMSETYLKLDHFNGGGSVEQRSRIYRVRT